MCSGRDGERRAERRGGEGSRRKETEKEGLAARVQERAESDAVRVASDESVGESGAM